MSELTQLLKYTRLADYISVAQIFLRSNFFLEEKLKPEHIKPRLLGHWGTTPGINFLYAHINRLINQNPDRDFLYVVGTGHGAPGYLSGVFIEGSISHFYNNYPFTKEGIEKFIRSFSAPYGFPSHITPLSPGSILEGGELGYSLSTAYGSVLDEPSLISVCLIGDGEAETGPLSASWNANRFIRPSADGAVLPVLHLNGYKISGPTIFGRMDDDEIEKFFDAHGYEALFIVGKTAEELHGRAMEVFDSAIERIKLIQTTDKTALVEAPRWPVVILKTPKGMGAPKEVSGVKVEGNYASHQVIFDNLKDKNQLSLLEEWLRSYKVNELIDFDKNGEIILDGDIKELIPQGERKVGRSKYAHRGAVDFSIPETEGLMEFQQVDQAQNDSAFVSGEYFAHLFKFNPESFRLFSPDETYSNHLQAVFDVEKRAFRWPLESWDKDMSPNGRVIEILSEHVLFGMLQGYTLTGRVGVFASYEAFAHIVSSMIDQYIKFIKRSKNVHFRKPLPPINIFLSSLLERQDHNGFSHQNPSFIANLLDHDDDIVRVYFPPDQNTALASISDGLSRADGVNVFVVGKRNKNIYFSPINAHLAVKDSLSVLEKFSDDLPHIVLVSMGDYVTESVVSAVSICKKLMPDVRVRVVSVLHTGALQNIKDETQTRKKLFDLLTFDKQVLWYYHGYARTIQKLLFGFIEPHRIQIKGYKEEGATTTPFDMKARNELSRFHIVKDVAEQAYKEGVIDKTKKDEVSAKMEKLLEKEKEYILKHGQDPKDLNKWAYEEI